MQTILELLSRNYVVSLIAGTLCILVALLGAFRRKEGANLLDWALRLLLLLMGAILLWRAFHGYSWDG